RVVQRLPRIGAQSEFPFNYYQTLHDHATTLASVFGEIGSNFHFAMTEPAPAEQIIVDAVTPEFFDALGVPALYGRTLTRQDGDENSGLSPVVLSYGFWRRRFEGGSGCGGGPDVRVAGIPRRDCGCHAARFQWTDARHRSGYPHSMARPSA